MKNLTLSLKLSRVLILILETSFKLGIVVLVMLNKVLVTVLIISLLIWDGIQRTLSLNFNSVLEMDQVLALELMSPDFKIK